MMNSINATLELVLSRVSEGACDQPVLICIDGPAGSGKTELAQALAQQLIDGSVVHMDDLYEGWANPFDSKLFDRIRDSIVLPHLQQLPITFAKWDWASDCWGPAQTLESRKTLILEGVGACAAPVRQLADVTVFLDAQPEQALERAIARDGQQLRLQLLQWQVAQAEHFAHDQTATNCSLVIPTLVNE